MTRSEVSYSDVEPEDLHKFGLIPEFIGRLPVVATVEELDVDALTDILTQPRNALVKQYQKIFSFEDADLEFTDEAIAAIVAQAQERGTGARGLRSILENTLAEVMFELPGRKDVALVTITEDTVRTGAHAEVLTHAELQKLRKEPA